MVALVLRNKVLSLDSTGALGDPLRFDPGAYCKQWRKTGQSTFGWSQPGTWLHGRNVRSQCQHLFFRCGNLAQECKPQEKQTSKCYNAQAEGRSV